MTKLKDLSGQRFGRLLVIERDSEGTRWGSARWRCQCDCGVLLTVGSSLLLQGTTSSCGCLRRELGVRMGRSSKKHGESSNNEGVATTPEYRAWDAMKSRCLNPKSRSYPHYGGRGVKIHPTWVDSYTTFLSDVGRRPSPDMSIDRINNNGNYEPGNVRWATRSQQNANKRQLGRKKRSFHEIDGVRKPISEWLLEYGISNSAFRKRVANGMTKTEAICAPIANRCGLPMQTRPCSTCAEPIPVNRKSGVCGRCSIRARGLACN
jgi:hypothetical protein